MVGFEGPFNFLSIVWLDIVLSGDNALIIGLAASSLSPNLRRKAILFGLVLAAVMRIFFASMTTSDITPLSKSTNSGLSRTSPTEARSMAQT